jgi:hypothetical protein
MRYWEIVAERIQKSGWSCGYCTVLLGKGTLLFIVDAHQDDGRRLIVHSDEKLSAFLELEAMTRAVSQA